MIAPAPFIAVVDESGRLTPELVAFFQQVSELAPLTGTGSPESSVPARVGRFYINTSGGAGAVLYVKRNSDIGGDNTKGWILV